VSRFNREKREKLGCLNEKIDNEKIMDFEKKFVSGVMVIIYISIFFADKNVRLQICPCD